MADKGIYLKLEIDDKGTPVIKSVDAAYAKAMQNIRSSTDVAGRVTDGLRGKLSNLAGSVFNLRNAFIGLTGSMVGLTAKKMVDAYLEQERAQNQLANAMKNAGTYTEAAFQELTRYANALQMTTRYGDEAVMGVMNLLETYGLTVEQTKWASKATMDFATALNMDLQGAARYVGMAMQGNIDMLARYIPALKATVTEELKTATATEKTAFFMKLMNEQFGGRAQGEMTTYGSKLTWLSNMFGEIQEAIVGGLIKTFEQQGMTQDATALSFKNLAQAMVTGAENVTKALLILGKTASAILGGLDAMWYGFLQLDEYATRAAIGIEKLSIAYAKWRGDSNFEKKALEELQEYQAHLVETLQLQESAAQRMGSYGEIIGTSTGQITETFGELRANIEQFGNSAPAAVDKVTGAIKGMGDASGGAGESKITEDMTKALEDYKKASLDIDKALYGSSHTLYEQKLADIERELIAYQEAGVEKDRIDKLRIVKQEELNREKIELEKDMQLEMLEASKGDSGQLEYEYAKFKADLEKRAADLKQAGIDELAIRDYVNTMTVTKQRDMEQDRIAVERDMQLEIIEAVGSEQEKAYAQFVDRLDDRVQELRRAGIEEVKIREYVNAQVLQLQEQANEKMQQYWDSMATDIKAAMSDTFAAMFEGEGEKIEEVWEELWKKLQKSYADMVTENFSGLITKVLKTEAVGGILDKMGLGGFAKAWEGTSTPPSLKVLDEQYDLQKTQQGIQEAILETLGGQAEATGASVAANIDLSSIDIGKGFDIFKDIFGKLGGKKETEPITAATEKSQLDVLNEILQVCKDILTEMGGTPKETSDLLSGLIKGDNADFGDMLKDILQGKESEAPITTIQTGGIDMSTLPDLTGIEGVDFSSIEQDMTYAADAAGELGNAAGEASSAAGGLSGALKGFGGKLSGFFGSGGAGGSALGAIGGIQGMVSTWNKDNYAGSNRWSGAAKGAAMGAAGGAAVGAATWAAVGSIIPGIGTMTGLLVGALVGGAGGFLGGENAERMEKNAERTKDYMKELEAIAKYTFSSLTEMTLSFDEMLEAKNINAMKNLGVISSMGAEALSAFAEALSQTKNEALASASTSEGTFRQMNMLLGESISLCPELAGNLEKIREQMLKLHTEDIFKEMTDGVLGYTDAIKKLMQQGMSQLESQTALFGDSYNELVVMMEGSIDVIYEASDAFKDIRDSLDRTRELVEQLPAYFDDLKRAMIEFLRVAEYVTNMSQSFLTLSQDMADLPNIFAAIKNAENFDEMASAIYELENVTQEAASAFWQLANYIDYIGFEGIAKNIGLVSTALNYFTAGITIVRMLTEAFGIWDEVQIAGLKIWREWLITIDKFVKADLSEAIADVEEKIRKLGGELNDTIDMWDLLEAKLENMDLSEIFDDLIDKAQEWQAILYETEFGTLKADMKDLLFDFAYALMQIEEIRKSADKLSGQDKQNRLDFANELEATARAAFIEKVEDYFEEIIDKFKELGEAVRSALHSVEMDYSNLMKDLAKTPAEALAASGLVATTYKRMFDDVNNRLTTAQGDLSAINPVEDPEEYLEKAEEVRDLIMERYDLEMQRIQELIDEQERIKDAFESVVEAVEDALFSIKKEGLNPQTAKQRMGYFETEADTLRGKIAGATTPEEKAGYQLELVALLQDYLGAAEEAYQRPSAAYKAIYDSVITEITAIGDIARNEVSKADAEIIRLQGEQITLMEQTWAELNAMQGDISSAKSSLESIKDDYISLIKGDVAKIKEWYENNSLPSLTTVEDNTGACKDELVDINDTLEARFPLASWWADFKNNRANTNTANQGPTRVTVNVEVPDVKVTVPTPRVTVSSLKVTVPQPKVSISSVKVSVPQPKVTVSSVKVTVPKITIPTPIVRVSQLRVNVPAPVVRIAQVKVNVASPVVKVPDVRVTSPDVTVTMPSALFKTLNSSMAAVNTTLKTATNRKLDTVAGFADEMAYLKNLSGISTKLTTINSSINAIDVSPQVNINTRGIETLLTQIRDKISPNETASIKAVPATITPLATGMKSVPYDNFLALLHKGEAVIPAGQNAQPQQKVSNNTINFSVNIKGGSDPKATVEALKKEIKYGTLGMVIADRVKTA